MARQDIQEQVTTITIADGDTIQLYDFLTPDWTAFEFTEGFQEYQLDSDEVDRFWIVSQKFYNSVEFADLLLLINGIDDALKIQTGTKIKIPTFADIQRFQGQIQSGNPPRIGG